MVVSNSISNPEPQAHRHDPVAYTCGGHRHLPKIVAPGSIQDVLPVHVTVGPRQDPIVLGPQRNRGPVAVRVVEAQAPLEHRPIGVHFGQGPGESRITHRASGELGYAIANHAQGTGLDNAIHISLATLAIEQTRLVIEGIGSQERIARSQVQQFLISIQLLIAEESECDIARPVALNDG